MALPAPQSAYRNYAYWVNNGSDIPHEAVILQGDKATMLSRFKLDGLLGVIGPDGTEGYVGFCYEGSANYQFHAAHRRGAGGAGGILFLDGGLNTFGDAYKTANFTLLYSNYLKCTILYKAAYYIGSGNFGVRFKPVSSGTWYSDESLLYQYRALSSNEEVNKVFDLEFDLLRFTEYEMQMWIDNSEGRWHSPSVVFHTGDRLERLSMFNRTGACTANGTFQQMYLTKTAVDRFPLITVITQNLNIYAYINPEMTIQIPTGYYNGGGNKTYYYQQGSGFTNYIECAPDPGITEHVILMIRVYANNTFEVNASKSNAIPVSTVIDFTATLVGKNASNNIIVSAPFAVSMGNGTPTQNTDWPFIGNGSNLTWSVINYSGIASDKVLAEVFPLL